MAGTKSMEPRKGTLNCLAVRSAPPEAVLLADGYSCRTQLAQLGGHRARHLAEVLAEALP